MLLNLTNRYSIKARDNGCGGIRQLLDGGPKFGSSELVMFEPFLRKGNVISQVNLDGFNIEGKAGDINPLTGDIIINPSEPKSISTAIDIEAWHILVEEDYSKT